MLTIGITFTEEMMTSTIGYIGDVISDLLPLILIVVAIGIGLWIFEAVISSIKQK